MNTVEIINYLTKELLDYEDDIQQITSSESHLTIHLHPELNSDTIRYYLEQYNIFSIQVTSNHTIQLTLPSTSTIETLDNFIQNIGFILIRMANKK